MCDATELTTAREELSIREERYALACSRTSDPSPSPPSAGPGSHTPGSSALAGFANLLNTVIGGGILSLPFAFCASGLGVGVAYQLVFGSASWFGSWLLLDALRYQPCKSYEALARAALGRWGALAYNAAALINCYGAMVSYIIVTGDILPPLLHEMGYNVSRTVVLAALTAIIILPLSSLRDISALQYSSGLAVLIYIAFVCTLLYLASEEGAAPRDWPLVRYDAAGWIRAVPLCAFAFLHQTSLFPIYQEMRDPSPRRMRAVVGASVGSAMVLYILTALAAYARFGDAIAGDILINLASVDSTAVRVVRLAFSVSVCLTYPCLHYAARRALDQILSDRGDAEMPTGYRLGLTIGLVSSSLVMAILVTRVEVIFGFTGALASTMISYVLPGAISLMARPHRLASWRRNGLTILFLTSGALCGLVALANHAVETFG